MKEDQWGKRSSTGGGRVSLEEGGNTSAKTVDDSHFIRSSARGEYLLEGKFGEAKKVQDHQQGKTCHWWGLSLAAIQKENSAKSA